MRAKDSPTGHTAAEVDAARGQLRQATVDLEAVPIVYEEDGRLTAATVEALVAAVTVVRDLSRSYSRCCDGPCDRSRLLLEEQFRRLRNPPSGEVARALNAAMFGARYRSETLGSAPSLAPGPGQPIVGDPGL